MVQQNYKCPHIAQQGLDIIRTGLKERRAKPVKNYSWLCHECGYLWTGFKDQGGQEEALKELQSGQTMFFDWSKENLESFISDGLHVVGIKAWDEPVQYASQNETLLQEGIFNPDLVEKYKRQQDECETKPLYDPQQHPWFSYLLDRMPIRGKIPGMDAEPDWYSANIAFAWYILLTDIPDIHKGVVGEMGPRTPKGPFPTSQVMFALAAADSKGTYVPLDYAEWPIMGLLGMHEWFKREKLLDYLFGEHKGTDWSTMGKKFKNEFDLLFASHFVEDFAFGWYFRERQKQQKGDGGYDAYPYDEMYHNSERAKVHWLRFMQDFFSDAQFAESFRTDLGEVIAQMQLCTRDQGYIALWHYPAYRLLHSGLVEESFFEMWLYREATRLLSERGFSKTDLSNQQELQHIPFSEAIRILKKV